MEVGEEIDAIEHRTAQPATMARRLGFAARAAIYLTGEAARARVAGSDEHEARRVQRRVACSRDRDAAILERLVVKHATMPRMATNTMDIYARVSKVGAREGDAYRSPDIQLDECRRWAAREGIHVGVEAVDENVKGSRAVKDRRLEDLLKRAEQGASGGVIVYKSDRFARDALQTLLSVKRLSDAGARMVGVADGVDSDKSKLTMIMMAALAEHQLDGIRSGFEASVTRAVADGIHVAGKAPVGYLRRDQVEPMYDGRGRLVRDGRLVVDPPAAEAVRGAFALRAEGASLGDVAAHMRQALGRSYGKNASAKMLGNEVYLGHAKGPGGAIKRGAHDPIVDAALFAAAQRKGTSYVHDGSMASQSRLPGLVVCAGCGYRMQVGRSRSGSDAAYRCAGRHAKKTCPAPASALVRLVDDLVLTEYASRVTGLIEDRESGRIDDAEFARLLGGPSETAWLAAKDTLAKAEAAYDAWIDDLDAENRLGLDRYRRGRELRREAVEDAQRRLYELPDPEIPAGTPTVTLGGQTYPYVPLGDDVVWDRRALARTVERVMVTKADPARGKWQPIAERVVVAWADGSKVVKMPRR
jgi:DNA invertase Pin-like site-specific DNA recombinase